MSWHGYVRGSLLPPEPEPGALVECVGGGPLDGLPVPYTGHEHVTPEGDGRLALYERAVYRAPDGARSWVYLHRGQRWPI